MHYCCLIVTKEYPTDDVLNKVLQPFNDDVVYEKENKEHPSFTWDWWQVGGRYSGMLKLSVLGNEDKYKWSFFAKTPRFKELFRSQLLDDVNKLAKSSNYPFFEEEFYFFPMGFRDGYIRVDGGCTDDITNLENVECYCCVDDNGVGYARESWNGKEFITHEDFDKKLEEIKKNAKGKYVCIVDLHD